MPTTTGAINYPAFKRRLIREGVLNKAFLRSADHMAIVATKAAARSAKSPYEPLLYETWIEDLGASLDRILSYRREARDLEVLAVKAAADYLLFCEQSKIELEQQVLALREKVKLSQKQTQSNAAAKFSGTSSLEAGFKTIAAGTAKDIDAELKDVGSEEALLNAKQKLLQNYQDAYFHRTTEDGNAHNYTQRASLLWRLLNEEVLDCYLKAVAIGKGIERIYGVNVSFNGAPAATTFIDDLVFWCRGIVRQLAIVKQDEVEYDVTVPLVQPVTSSGRPVVDELVFDNALMQTLANNQPFNLNFNLASTSFAAGKVRVKRVGLSYGTETKILDSGTDRNFTTDSYARYQATIATPDQSTVAGVPAYRPAVQLGAVTVFGSGIAVCSSDGLECQNIDPNGTWSITIQPNPVYKDRNRQNIGAGIAAVPIKDLKLHLKLRTVGAF